MVSINDALDQFLTEIGEGNPNSSSSPRSIIDSLRSCLSSYAHEGLSEFERARFDKEWSDDRAYCDIFGPRNLDPSHINYFLNFFVVRHVAGTKAFLKACGPLMEELAKWLMEKEYWTQDQMVYFQELVGDEPGDDLVACEKFKQAIFAYVASHPVADPNDIPDEDYLEDHFTITKVEPGKLCLDAFDQGEIALSMAALLFPFAFSSPASV